MLRSKSCGVKKGCSNSSKTSTRDAKGAAGRQGRTESVSLQDVRMSLSHRSGPVWKTPRNSGLCTATARPAMNVPQTVRTGEMLPCPGNNLRRYCSRTHRHASPHHRVTPFEWSLSLDMSQRRDNQMTDDRLAVGPCSACLPRPRSPRPGCWPKLETDTDKLITANR